MVLLELSFDDPLTSVQVSESDTDYSFRALSFVLESDSDYSI